MAKKKTPSKREMRSMRTQQIIFVIIGVLIIISMIISMFAR
jgi:hypothetical protein